MRDQRQVHGLLHGVGRQHGEAGGAAEHHVRVVAKDREGVGGYGAGADVERRRRELSAICSCSGSSAAGLATP